VGGIQMRVVCQLLQLGQYAPPAVGVQDSQNMLPQSRHCNFIWVCRLHLAHTPCFDMLIGNSTGVYRPALEHNWRERAYHSLEVAGRSLR
jgi:hypothetical protein